jgi:hypothetical protein
VVSYVSSSIVAAQTVPNQTAGALTGVQPGDFLLIGTCASLATQPVWTTTTFTGWTTQINTSVTSMPVLYLWRIADGTSADNPPTIATNANAHRVTVAGAWRGVDNTNPFIASNGQGETVSQTSQPTPSLTNTDPAAWAIYLSFARQVATPLTWSPTAGNPVTTERQDKDVALAQTNNAAGCLYDSNGVVAAQTVALAASTSAATSRVYAWGAFLRPASAAAPAYTGTAALSGTGSLTGSGTPRVARSGSMSGTGTLSASGTVPSPKAATLTSTFDTLDPAVWYIAPNATVSGGRLTLTTSATYQGVSTYPRFDLTGSAFYVEVPQVTNAGNGTVECEMFVQDNNVVNLLLTKQGPNLVSQWSDATGYYPLDTRAYSATAHRWWRISESGGIVTWAASPDGVTWTTLATVAPAAIGFDPTAVALILNTGFYGASEPNPGTAVFDNLNTLPSTAPAYAGSGTLSGYGVLGTVPLVGVTSSASAWTNSATSVPVTLSGLSGGELLLLAVMHRSTLTAPPGWTLLTSATPFPDEPTASSGVSQWQSIFWQRNPAATTSASISPTQATAGRMNAVVLALSGAADPVYRPTLAVDVDTGAIAGANAVMTSTKDTSDLVLWFADSLLWAQGGTATADYDWRTSPALPSYLAGQRDDTAWRPQLAAFADPFPPGARSFTGVEAVSGSNGDFLHLRAVQVPAAATAGTGGVPRTTGTASLSGTGTLSATRADWNPTAPWDPTAAWGPDLPPAPAYTGAGVLSGTGSLTATGVPRQVGAASLSGTGTLAATGIPRPVAVAALSGTGSLTASGAPRLTQVASLAGTGTLSASGAPRVAAAAALSGTGSLTGSGAAVVTVGSAALAGSGFLRTVLAARTDTFDRTAGSELGGSGPGWQVGGTGRWTIDATGGYATRPAGGSTDITWLAGFGDDQEVSAQIVQRGTGTGSSTGLVARYATGNAYGVRLGTSGELGLFKVVGGVTTVLADNIATTYGAVVPTGCLLGLRVVGSTLTVLVDTVPVLQATDTDLPTGDRVGMRAATAASGTLPLYDNFSATTLGAGVPGAVQTGGLTGTGSLTAAGAPAVRATPALTGAGTLTGSGTSTQAATGTAALSGTGTLTASGTALLHAAGTASLSGTGTLSAAGTALQTAGGTASLTGAGSLTAAGTSRLTQATSLSGAGSLTATGTALVQAAGTGSLSGSGSLAAAGVPAIGARPGYDAAVLADAPAAYWPMSDAGGTLTDARGALSGSYTGAPGIVTLPNGDPARVFDGATQYATVPDADLLSVPTTGQLTLELWLRPDVNDFANPETSADGPLVYPLYKGDTYGTGGNIEYAVRMYSRSSTRPNRISGYLFNPEGALGAGSYFQDTTVPGVWIHVAVVFDTVNKGADGWGTVSIYKNGILRDTDTLGDPYDIVPVNGTAPLWLGARPGHSWFQGAIGKVAVYPYRLTPAQLAAHTQAMNPLPGAPTLTGTGTLTASGTATQAAGGAVVLTGTGSLTASGTALLRAAGTADLSGAGSLAATGAAGAAASGALTGEGLLTAAGTALQTAAGTAVLAGTGTLTGSGIAALAAAGTGALSGSGSLTGTGTSRLPGTAALTGSGGITASGSGSTIGGGSGSLSGAGSLTAPAARITVAGAAVLAGTGLLSAAPGAVGGLGQGQLSGAGDLSGTGVGTIAAAASGSLTGTGVLTASGTALLRAAGAAALSGAGTLTGSGTGLLPAAGSATLSGTGVLRSGGLLQVVGTASLSGAGALTVAGRPTGAASGFLDGTGELTGSGAPSGIHVAALSGSGSLTAAGTVQLARLAQLEGQGQLRALGVPAVSAGSALLTGEGLLTAIGIPARPPVAPGILTWILVGSPQLDLLPGGPLTDLRVGLPTAVGYVLGQLYPGSRVLVRYPVSQPSSSGVT